MTPEVDALKQFFAAINRNEMKGEKVVVYLHAWVRLKDATEWTGGRFADGFVFRNGRITEYRSFGERVQALEWAGIQDQELI